MNNFMKDCTMKQTQQNVLGDKLTMTRSIWIMFIQLSTRGIWFTAFLYALLVGLIIQLIILPNIFPSLHLGHGLLVGNDASTFYYHAAELAERIKKIGWSEWSLTTVEGRAPTAFMAALFVFFPAEPWVIVPLYASFFATSVALLYEILCMCGFAANASRLGILPFLLFPSCALLFAVPHKDGFFVCGSIMFFYSLLLIAVRIENEFVDFYSFVKMWFSLFVIGLSGAWLVWAVRPYAIDILVGTAVFLALVITFRVIIKVFRQEMSLSIGGWILILWVFLALIKPMFGGYGYGGGGGGGGGGLAGDGKDIVAPKSPSDFKVFKGFENTHNAKEIVVLTSSHFAQKWVATDWLPRHFDNLFFRLAETRYLYSKAHQSAASAVDVDLQFHQVKDVLHYLPRALMVGLFAPFPADWVGEGSRAANTLMRRFSGLEMVIWYFLVSFFVFHFFSRSHFDFYAVFLAIGYAVSEISVYVIAIPNMGTVYRMRLGFFMIMIGIAAASAATVIVEFFSKIER